jgi:pimeloyl-ACP methyl ester carboxylesterase
MRKPYRTASVASFALISLCGALIAVPAHSLARIDVSGPPEHSSILFIPGTLTSRLYMRNSFGLEQELWEPRSNIDISQLEMDGSGKSKNEIYTRDLVDRFYSNDALYSTAASIQLKEGANVYAPYERFMDAQVSSGTIFKWRTFPYDWRYDAASIVNDGVRVAEPYGPIYTTHLQDIVAELASTSWTGKVTIVAHSNGGLIAKALAIDLQKKGQLGLIDRIVFVGTPHYGTPKAILDMLHGEEFTELGGLLMYGNSVRVAEKTMPGTYDLLPSAEIFANEYYPIITFDTVEPAAIFRKVFGAAITTSRALTYFLSDAFNLDRSAGLPGSLKTPLALSATLLEKSRLLHQTLDGWTPPPQLAITTIAGWGMPTPYVIRYSGTNGLACSPAQFLQYLSCTFSPQLSSTVVNTNAGDDTVLTKSAVGKFSNPLYFDQSSFETITGERIVHGSLLNAAPVQAVLSDLIESNPHTELYISKMIPTTTATPYTVIAVHSPMILTATNAAGQVTGVVPFKGLPDIYFEKKDIVGSYVQNIGEDKYIYVPKNGTYSVSLQGYGTGISSITIGVQIGAAYQEVKRFEAIPTTASTTAQFFVGPDAFSSNELQVDVQGTHTLTTFQDSAAASPKSPAHLLPRFPLLTFRTDLGSEIRKFLAFIAANAQPLRIQM